MPDIPDEQRELLERLQATLHRPRSRRGPFDRQLMEHIIEYLETTDKELHPEFKNLWQDYISRSSTPRIHSHRLNELERVTELIDERTPIQIPDLDISSGDNIVFLLGAGASVASDIPTVSGLLDVLLDQARRTRRDDLQPLIEYCDEQEDVDIEDLLTAAYLADFAVSNRHVTRLLHNFIFSEEDSFSPDDMPMTDPTSVNFIQDTLQTLFGSITGTMIPKGPNSTHEAIREFVEIYDNTSIITTNYDYCMDQELLNNDIGLRSTIGGGEEEYDEVVDLIKMHGSINWWYCNSCQNVTSILPSEVKKSLGDNSLDYAVLGICPECQGQRRPLLVPPISFKFLIFPPLIEIWNQSKIVLEEADYIIPIGYSFSDSDAYVYKLISRSMIESDNTNLILVDPDRGITKRLKKRFEAELTNIDSDKRIKGIHEPSQEAVPKLVDKMAEKIGSGPQEPSDE